MSASTATQTPGGARRATGGSTRRRSNRPSLAEQRRRRERRIRRIRRALIVVLVVALLAAAGWLVGFSSVLATERVAVSGTRLLTVDGVKTAAAVPIGLPLARQDTTAIAERVASLAPVDTVTVDRSWPNTVSIKVVERTPLVAVEGRGRLSAGGPHRRRASRPSSLLPTGVVEVGIDQRQRRAAADAGTIAAALPTALRDQVATIDRRRARLVPGAPGLRAGDHLGQRRRVGAEGPGRPAAAEAEAQSHRRLRSAQPRRPLTRRLRPRVGPLAVAASPFASPGQANGSGSGRSSAPVASRRSGRVGLRRGRLRPIDGWLGASAPASELPVGQREVRRVPVARCARRPGRRAGWIVVTARPALTINLRCRNVADS